jgi:hypothetical protein
MIVPILGIAAKCASKVTSVAPALAQVAPIQNVIYRNRTATTPQICHDFAKNSGDVPVDWEHINHWDRQELIEIREVLAKPGTQPETQRRFRRSRRPERQSIRHDPATRQPAAHPA